MKITIFVLPFALTFHALFQTGTIGSYEIKLLTLYQLLNTHTMFTRLFQSLSKLCVISFCIIPGAKAQPDLDGQLIKGTYKVGFYSTISFDPSQNYPFYLDSASTVQKAPKPLVTNVWYPAMETSNQKTLLRKEYFDFESKNPQVAKWLVKLKKYNEGGIVSEIFQKDKNELDGTENILLDSLLNSSTNAIRNAKPIKQKFPFVIYAQGSGGTLDDNSVFCELLASHGYVVIGSSFQHNEADYLGPSGPPKSVRDIAFLLSFAKSLPNVDYYKAGMVGHSLGAQKMLHFMSQGATPFDALISLETTQEYHTFRNKMWNSYVSDVKREAFDIQGDFLFATDVSAIHMLADEMRKANRYYLLTPAISHNDYISQGIQRKYILTKKLNTTTALAKYTEARDQYTRLCNYMIQFLDTKLKKDSLGWVSTVNTLSADTVAGFRMETMPIGQISAWYNHDVAKLPTPRQLKFMIMDGHIDSVVLLLNKFWEKDSKQEIYDPTFAYPMIDYLIGKDTGKALQLYRAYVGLIGDEEINHKFITWAKIFRLRYFNDEAEASLNALYILNPKNRDRVKLLIEKNSK